MIFNIDAAKIELCPSQTQVVLVAREAGEDFSGSTHPSH